ncbi:unnamed protein product [Effrenium voratum]|nr:unnamed protein product [Effrenium voratum]
MHRLHTWFGLSNGGLEEAVLRAFHPLGPLEPHLAAMEQAAFVFPLRRLPPRTLKTVLSMAQKDGFRRDWRQKGFAVEEDLNNSLVALLGPERLAKASGDLEGLALTAREFMLCTLVYYVVAEPPLPPKTGTSGSTGMAMGASTSAAWSGASSGASSALGGGASGGASGARARPGTLSATFERLLLAHLHAYLPHRQYEVARAQESHCSLFFTRLVHEFLIVQRPFSSAASVLKCLPDARLQAPVLHSARLVLLHVLANPCLRQGCEETAERLMFAGPGKGGAGRARVTRELALLGPGVVLMLRELLQKLQGQKEVGLEAVTSLTRLWLILLQPWKARRLHEWYQSLRPPEPRLEPPKPSAASGNRPVDVALLGLEPEIGEVTPLVPKEYVEEAAASSLGATTRLAAAAGLTSANLTAATAAAQLAQLVPGDGDALSWRNYIGGFQGAYFLLEAFLCLPLHAELCLELCRLGAGWDRTSLFTLGASAAFGRPALNAWSGPGPSGSQLLRQRNAVQALKALGQALLCFSDHLLLQVLQGQAIEPGVFLQDRVALELPMLPLFDHGQLRPQLATAIAVVWAALLSSASVVELQPLLAAISRQLQHAPQFEGLPALEDTAHHKPFAERVLQELGQVSPAAPAPPAASASVGAGPPATNSLSAAAEFVGSEWQRPVRGGELEVLLCIAYWLANRVDRLLGRGPRITPCGPVPQTEWPRMFGNWKFSLLVSLALWLAVLW